MHVLTHQELLDMKEELEYLSFFHQEADFGPAHESAVMIIDEKYVKETGNKIPKGY